MRTSRQNKPQQRKEEKKKKPISLDETIGKRLVLFLAAITLALLCLVGRISYIMAQQGEDYEYTILSQQDYSSTVIAARRGTITDRNGTILATSERIYTLILDPKVILANNAKNEEATLTALAAQFNFDYTDLKNTVSQRSTSSYVRYAKEISYETKTAFDTYKSEYNSSAEAKEAGYIKGVWFEEDYKRVYPFKSLACSVLGFSSGDAGRGNWGLEEYYNDILVGTNGREYGYINTDGEAERTVIDAEDGYTIVSTLDYTIQDLCEKAIADFLTTRQADNVSVIVMNPNNAEILAMGSNRVYDLNDPSDLSYMYTAEEIAAMTEEQLETARGNMWKNYSISDAFEPGSTAKPFTVAAALENCLADDNCEYNCTGSRSFGSGDNEVTVKCNNVEGHGVLNLTESIMQSCNCAMMDIAATLGAERFSEYQNIFGFGKQTGIDLPGENGGLLYSAEAMGSVDLATNAFGQNFTVNALQLAAAFCSLINGGNYYQPHVVKQIQTADGQIVKNIEPTLVRKTVTSETSDFIKNALLKTVSEGTGKTGRITGYSIGGKTGTAEKLPREDKKYIVSFISMAPAENPELLVYVTVDNPVLDTADGETISAKIAIELEKTIMESIIPYYNLTPDLGASASEPATQSAEE